MNDDRRWMDENGDMNADIADAIDAGIPVEKAFRISFGRSIENLATEADIDPHRLARIEAGATPSADELNRLGVALNVPADILVND